MGDVQLPSIFIHFHPFSSIDPETDHRYDGFVVAHELPGLGKSKGRRVSKKGLVASRFAEDSERFTTHKALRHRVLHGASDLPRFGTCFGSCFVLFFFMV